MPSSLQQTIRAQAYPRVLLVDDDRAFLDMLDIWLRSTDMQVESTSDPLEALCRAAVEGYDVVVTDLAMPQMDGLELMHRLKEIDSTIEVVFLTGAGTMDDAIDALRCRRAFDFLRKPLRNLTQLNDTLFRAAAQRQQARSMLQAEQTVPAAISPLSPCEQEILALLGQGLTNKQIGDRLSKSEKTIKNQLTRIYEKLGVKNRALAVLTAQQRGLIREST